MSEALIKKFEHVKKEYVKAFKAKLFDLCRKLGDKLFEIVEQLRAQGLKNTDLGLSPDGEYIIRSFEMVAKNPTSPHTDSILADAKRLCNGYCEERKRYTMIGMEIVEISEDGSLSFPEPTEPESQPDIKPILMPKRNCDIQREMRGEN
jgi:hypothetical protein